MQGRATKLLPSMDSLSYKKKRLQKLKLPTLVYRRLRGDMMEVYKIIHGIYDMKVSPCLTIRSRNVACNKGPLHVSSGRAKSKKTKKRILYPESRQRLEFASYRCR